MGDVGDDEGWGRVAAWLKSEIQKQGLTLRRIELEGGVAYRTVQKLLDGSPVARRDALSRLSNFLGYRADAIDRVLAGDEPERETSAAPGAGQRDYNSKIARISEGAQAAIDAIIEAEERKLQG